MNTIEVEELSDRLADFAEQFFSELDPTDLMHISKTREVLEHFIEHHD